MYKLLAAFVAAFCCVLAAQHASAQPYLSLNASTLVTKQEAKAVRSAPSGEFLTIFFQPKDNLSMTLEEAVWELCTLAHGEDDYQLLCDCRDYQMNLPHNRWVRPNDRLSADLWYEANFLKDPLLRLLAHIVVSTPPPPPASVPPSSSDWEEKRHAEVLSLLNRLVARVEVLDRTMAGEHTAHSELLSRITTELAEMQAAIADSSTSEALTELLAHIRALEVKVEELGAEVAKTATVAPLAPLALPAPLVSAEVQSDVQDFLIALAAFWRFLSVYWVPLLVISLLCVGILVLLRMLWARRTVQTAPVTPVVQPASIAPAPVTPVQVQPVQTTAPAPAPPVQPTPTSTVVMQPARPHPAPVQPAAATPAPAPQRGPVQAGGLTSPQPAPVQPAPVVPPVQPAPVQSAPPAGTVRVTLIPATPPYTHFRVVDGNVDRTIELRRVGQSSAKDHAGEVLYKTPFSPRVLERNVKTHLEEKWRENFAP